MKKHLFTVVLLCSIAFSAFSQKTKDVLYLKNGSMIFGKLVEASNENYRIQTSDGSILIYPASEVDKFTRERPSYDVRKASGFTFTLETGLLAGSQDTRFTAPFSFNALAGYTGNTRNIVSFGSGVEFFGRPYTPFFIEYKNIINTRKTSPFVFIRGGAVVPIGQADEGAPSMYNQYPKEYGGGASFTLGTGISWAREDFATALSFAYRYAHISRKQYEYNGVGYTYSDNLNRLEIKFGFTF
ncbi:MAG TPA: hypothetical protein VK207_09655 [Bacteroidales bacterium]|jgi:hypothetical protein|nr:hypothetical protein [Bacteroidales bacterium]